MRSITSMVWSSSWPCRRAERADLFLHGLELTRVAHGAAIEGRIDRSPLLLDECDLIFEPALLLGERRPLLRQMRDRFVDHPAGVLQLGQSCPLGHRRPAMVELIDPRVVVLHGKELMELFHRRVTADRRPGRRIARTEVRDEAEPGSARC